MKVEIMKTPDQMLKGGKEELNVIDIKVTDSKGNQYNIREKYGRLEVSVDDKLKIIPISLNNIGLEYDK